MTNDQANAYLRTQVMTASPEQLRLMLLDGAVRFGRQGLDGLERRDYEASYEGISQCRAIVMELLTTIREEAAPEVAQSVRSVYTFLYGELVDVAFSREPERMRKVVELLEYERETWKLLMDRVAQERGADSSSEATRQATKHAAGSTNGIAEAASPTSLSLEA